MIDRRAMLRRTTGAALAGGLLSRIAGADDGRPLVATSGGGLRRVVFFLQNQGFDPKTCVPEGLTESTPLDGVALPEPISPLEPVKDRIHIVTGLHGRHTSPSHSAYFGALGGYRGGIGVAPSGPTIDHALTESLEPAILPHLRIGMDALSNMRSRPTLATLTASGAGQPQFMHSNPVDVYRMLFGSIATGDVRKTFEARSRMFDRIEQLAVTGGRTLPLAEQARYRDYTDGFREVNGLRQRLAAISDHLRTFAPAFDAKFTDPEHETDWHDALLELSIATLQAGVTNVCTIGSGRGEIFGSWKGLGVERAGHDLGHMDQPDNPIWIKIRQYNCRMLVRLIEQLEAVPEAGGSMMDHTLIVYTSNNADRQHTAGGEWPFILLGDGGGQFRTGMYTRLAPKRPVNDLYTTLLRATGRTDDRFNIDGAFARTYGSQAGPIEELMA